MTTIRFCWGGDGGNGFVAVYGEHSFPSFDDVVAVRVHPMLMANEKSIYTFKWGERYSRAVVKSASE